VKVNDGFWQAIDTLVARSVILIDRPRGTRHPRYAGLVYPVDYGYLEGTSSMDGGGVDVWKGTDPGQRIDAIICTVDLCKMDSEIKILIGCTGDEKQRIYDLHNESESMKGILIHRDGAAAA
jgi:inorganic pyrophosphatase